MKDLSELVYFCAERVNNIVNIDWVISKDHKHYVRYKEHISVHIDRLSKWFDGAVKLHYDSLSQNNIGHFWFYDKQRHMHAAEKFDMVERALVDDMVAELTELMYGMVTVYDTSQHNIGKVINSNDVDPDKHVVAVVKGLDVNSNNYRFSQEDDAWEDIAIYIYDDGTVLANYMDHLKLVKVISVMGVEDGQDKYVDTEDIVPLLRYDFDKDKLVYVDVDAFTNVLAREYMGNSYERYHKMLYDAFGVDISTPEGYAQLSAISAGTPISTYPLVELYYNTNTSNLKHEETTVLVYLLRYLNVGESMT